jgi:arylsulfatase A-like enzyme
VHRSSGFKHRPAVIGLALLVLLAGFLSACDEPVKDGPGAAGSDTPRTPNLLLITLDTTRADALGAYGQRLPASPHIDALAREGVLFEQATTSNPETLPAHATLLTGKWPFRHGVRSNGGGGLALENETLAEHLEGYGYRTAAEVAAPVLDRRTQIGQGFDEFTDVGSPGVAVRHFLKGDQRAEAEKVRPGSDITDRGLGFLRENRDRKFFLWLHYFDPHSPYDPPEEFRTRIPDSDYHAEVAFADHQIGRLVTALADLGLQDDTLIVVMADHGEGRGDHAERGHSMFVYQATMRVPLVFSGLPVLAAGRRIDAPVRSVDVVPTVLDLLGLPPLESIDGVTLRPLITGEAADLELTGYGEAKGFSTLFPMSMLRFVREGRWKYIHKVEPELYDLSADPEELDDRIASHPEVAERLLASLEAMLSVAGSAPVAASEMLSEEAKQQLMALGYVDEDPSATAGAERDTLQLHGPDPRDMIADAATVIDALAMIARSEFLPAIERLGPVYERSPDSTRVASLLTGALLAVGRDDEALELMLANFDQLPCSTQRQATLDRLLRERRRLEDLARVLRHGAEHCEDDLPNLNNYAWLLATSTAPELRDGPKAVGIMNRLLAGQGDRTPVGLDTLAAAHAESGDFEQAIRLQTEVVEAAGAGDLPAPVQAGRVRRLEAYRAGEPIRDPL